MNINQSININDLQESLNFWVTESVTDFIEHT